MEEVKEVESSDNLLPKYEIPVIDLGGRGAIKSPTESYLQDIATQVDNALQTKGLAFFINHGISEERLKSVNKAYDDFLALPDDVKKQYVVSPPECRQGYIPAGLEVLDKTKSEARDGFNIQCMTEKLPTEEVPFFKEVIGGVVEDFQSLANLVIKLIAIILELDFERLMNFHKFMMKGCDQNPTTFRMLYYPPVDGKQLDKFTRCGEHTDWGTFTLLTEDSEGGFEIYDGKEWASLCHTPGAILLNLGDAMELWTSSQYKAIKHRVVIPADVKLQARGRHSFALFIHPDNNAPMNSLLLNHCRTGEPLDESVGPNSYEYIVNKLKDAFY